jgi:hypothetical protein
LKTSYVLVGAGAVATLGYLGRVFMLYMQAINSMADEFSTQNFDHEMTPERKSVTMHPVARPRPFSIFLKSRTESERKVVMIIVVNPPPTRPSPIMG